VSGELLALIAGLALLDSLNPATMVAVALILLTAQRRPALTAAAVVVGAALTVATVGAVLFLSAGAVAGAVDGVLIGLRVVAFGAAGTALVIAGVRRLRDRPRRPLELPPWFSPATALPFGVIVTAADLPNAFPYFIAIERMLAADTAVATGLLVIAVYAVIYCVPCLVLLGVGLVSRDRTRSCLQTVTRRFTEGVVRRSVLAAVLLMVTGVAVASIPFILMAVA
jgi:cytochrome c biogenesis protein CcdA